MAEPVSPDRTGTIERDFVRALDLHKERIRRLQEALCECQQRDMFQADLHDETCPVYVVAEQQRKEYDPRVYTNDLEQSYRDDHV